MKKLSVFLFSLLVSLFFVACNGDDDMTCVAVLQDDCVCYQVYAPVCGCDEVTYSNDCYAECNGITDYTVGPCK